MTGVLVLAATPLGDADDASPRLTRELGGADLVLAEDTRSLRRLAAKLGVEVTAPVSSFFEGNETSRLPALRRALEGSARVVLVTDAGTPSVSDPGYRAVQVAQEVGARVTAVPGPSAVLVALTVSGLPVDRFAFDGFLPRKAGEVRRRLETLVDERRTVVLFESPHRLASTLAAAADVLGADREAAVCRELTKTYEEVVRAPLGELAERFADGTRGEVTLVLAGAPVQAAADDDAVASLVAEHREAGASTRDAVAAVVAATGRARREVYAIATR